MKCEIRTVITTEDADLIALVEKCKEKHRLAELIERALVAYCYEDAKETSENTPENQQNIEDKRLDTISKDVRKLATDMAVISSIIQNNHLYTVESLGRLSGEIGALSKHGILVAGDTGADSEPVSISVPEIEPEFENVEPKPESKPEPKPAPKPEPKPEPKSPKPEPKPESKDDEDDDEGLSPEAAALMAQFFGG